MEVSSESEIPKASTSGQQNKDIQSKNPKRFKSSNHSMKKREPHKPVHRKNDFFVTGKSNFKAQEQKIKELLADEFDEVFLHCIGAAINRGINLALTLVNGSNGLLNYEANTSTIELIDDFHPLRDDDDITIQKRMNSCLHIRIFKDLPE